MSFPHKIDGPKWNWFRVLKCFVGLGWSTKLLLIKKLLTQRAFPTASKICLQPPDVAAVTLGMAPALINPCSVSHKAFWRSESTLVVA